ncbi:hypothetical protein BMS3Bbin10_01712 [bacterium BMS3Bbin10]|nr:hypothetical protein BMS3Bbin10_01712 [bacterium BMS3Bbin10]
MFIRSLSIFGAAAAFLAVQSADAEAFGRHHGGGKYKTCYKKVVTPPIYRTVTERVMVSPASCTQLRTPPVYGTVAQQVVVQPSYQVVRTKPAVYGRVRVTRQVRPARTRWVRRSCRGADYRCAVTTPAKYRTRSKRVMVEPAQNWVETRPAVTGVVERRVVLRAGTVRQLCQPALYRTVTRQVMVSPGRVQWVPAQPAVQPVVYRQPAPQSRYYRPAVRYAPLK